MKNIPILAAALVLLPLLAHADDSEGGLSEEKGPAAVDGKPAAPQPAAPLAIDKLPVQSALKGIRCHNGAARKIVPISPDDVEWAARMVHAETGGHGTEEDAKAMLWAMTQRICWSPTWNRYSFTALLKAYSQPINTAWTRHGKNCGKLTDEEVEELEQKEKDSGNTISEGCAKHRFPAREKFLKIKWADFNESARRVTVDLFSGQKVGNPIPGGVGWFSKGKWGKASATYKKKEHMAEYKVIGGNMFIQSTNPDTTAWTGKEVTIQWEHIARAAGAQAEEPIRPLPGAMKDSGY